MLLQRGLGGAFTAAALVLRPPLRLLTSRQWAGAEHLPPPGTGFVVVANHMSWADPVTLGDFLVTHRRLPRYLAKESLWRIPVVGAVLRGAKAVPVRRGSGDAARALAAAQEAVRAGECVVVYPDGTLTKDPQLWPMVGKTGAARIALATGCPVVPIAQWGPQLLLPRTGRPRLLPRPRLQLRAGPPVDLSDLTTGPATGAAGGPAPDRDVPVSAEVLRRATDRLVAAVVAEMEVLRGQSAPAHRWDPRTDGRPGAPTDPAPDPSADPRTPV